MSIEEPFEPKINRHRPRAAEENIKKMPMAEV